MRMKRTLATLLLGMLLFTLCSVLLPGVALAAGATEVRLYPGGAEQVLNATNPYLVSDQAATSGTLGKSGCTAWFHDDPLHGSTLEIQGLSLSGAGTPPSWSGYFAALYASGDLRIVVHGTGNRITTAGRTASATEYTRALFIQSGSLTLSGNGSLAVTTGDGYGTTSCAISCSTSGTLLTVESGVALDASVGTTMLDANYGITAVRLVNHGRITATGKGAGVYVSVGAAGGADSTSDGYLKATGTTGCGLSLSSTTTFKVNGGTAELIGATGKPAVGHATAGNPVGTFIVGPAVTGALMGTSAAAATARTPAFVIAHYKDTNPVYSYLRLTAAEAASVPKTGDRAPLPLLCALAVFSGAGLVISRAVRKRRETR